ncbi:TetR/AcrR family transcriptional regulator [Frondihabitans sp. PAMC 28766]|uniref:TetR/AcrR family transcriptional regulator n=1 Tax=Frondihabitans sp. PAMC 28766 TaxID=1795630 RepID=UPI001950320C|nr:TetR/AcrR family transcriptional regulator [Frondihabitans sp. PAMC 28766]
MTPRRTDPLSKERIVEIAIDVLDDGGENGLTFRALAAILGTGAGAIYHHVESKAALLAAATDTVIGRVVADADSTAAPTDRIRALALGVFDAIEVHPWVGAELSREPWQLPVVQIFDGFGTSLTALGVPRQARFNAATALLNYLLGLAAQYAAGSRLGSDETDRAAFLKRIAGQWAGLDGDRYPFMREVAAQLPDHDDRAQFIAGFELILVGIESLTERHDLGGTLASRSATRHRAE